MYKCRHAVVWPRAAAWRVGSASGVVPMAPAAPLFDVHTALLNEPALCAALLDQFRMRDAAATLDNVYDAFAAATLSDGVDAEDFRAPQPQDDDLFAASVAWRHGIVPTRGTELALVVRDTRRAAVRVHLAF